MIRRRRLVAVLGVIAVAGLGGAVLAGGSSGDSSAGTVASSSLAGSASGPASTTAPSASATCGSPSPGTHRLLVDARHPAVVLHVPPGAAPSTRRPLILVLAGANEDAEDIASYTGYSRLADRENFLVAYAAATGKPEFWNVSGSVAGKPDDVAYLRAVITTLTGPAACAAPDRVGLTGVSNGGGMTARMACDAADLLAAAAPVAGGYSTLPDCHPERPLAILEIHGLKDTVVPYGGDATGAGSVGRFLDGWRRRDSCPGRARRSAPAGDVLELRWTCAGGRQVVHDRVTDAQHGWPGESSLRPFSSTSSTWKFLTAFRDEDAPTR